MHFVFFIYQCVCMGEACLAHTDIIQICCYVRRMVPVEAEDSDDLQF